MSPDRQTRDRNSTSRIEVIPATPEHEPIFANLLQLYAHDFSEFHDVELGPDGRFTYKELPLYWRDPNRHPFLIHTNGQLAGFALVKKEISNGPSLWDVTEFFILRAYRRQGVGTVASHKVWNQFPGQWQVRVRQKNDSARNFWQRAIRAFTGREISSSAMEKNNERWHLFVFESPGSNSL